MVFINSNPNRSLLSIGTNSINKGSGYGSGSDFVSDINKILRPSVNFNTQLNLNFGKGENSGTISGKKADKSETPNKNNGNGGGKGSGRPHQKYANDKETFFIPSEVKTSSITFSTSIKSGTLINPYENSSCNENCTLFTLSGTFLPVSKESVSYKLITGLIYFDKITKVQEDVNYRIIERISPDQFYGYFSDIADALQLYYCVDSILAYCSNVSNTNAGMSYLRTLLTAEILSKQEELKRTLVNCAVPPNLLAFIAYMHQNFRFEDLNNAAIFKLEFGTIFHSTSDGRLSTERYDKVIDSLRSTPTISSILRKGVPSFVISDLPPSSSQPIFDQNFKSFWYNSNTVHIDKESNLQYNRKVDSADTDFYYGSFCNEDIDGIFYACSSPYSNRSKVCEPGIWAPISGAKALLTCTELKQKSSILCYDNSYNMMISPCSKKIAAQSGLFSSLVYDSDSDERFTINLNLNPAAQKVQVHNVNNTLSATSQSVIYLFNENR